MYTFVAIITLALYCVVVLKIKNNDKSIYLQIITGENLLTNEKKSPLVSITPLFKRLPYMLRLQPIYGDI